MNVPITSSAILPPWVKDISHASLVQWKKKRHEYEDAISARCSASGEDISKALMTVKSTFDHALLKMLCKYDWEVPFESITEERILTEIDKIVNNVKNGSIVNIDALFDDELRMDLHESDVHARVVNYFKLCEDIISRNGLQTTFGTSMGITHKCTILRKHLQPTALRDELVKEKALEQEKVFRSVANRKRLQQQPKQENKTRHGERRANGKHDSDRTAATSKSWGNKRKVQSETSTERNVKRPQTTGSLRTATKSKPRGGCFNCGKDHWLSECPDIDEAEKEAILAKRGSKKQSEKRFRVKRVNPRTKTQGRVRSTATLNAKLDLPYCADSGSDWNIISHNHVKELQALDCDVEVAELDRPVELEAVGGAVLTATHGVDVYLCLNTAAGPVRCQDPKRCLVAESDDEELIVGRVLLAELGIDVDRELEQLAARNLNDDDEFGDSIGIPMREDTLDEDVAIVINGMVVDCVERGIVSPGTEEDRLRNILASFKGWRLALGDDPPARVPPLRIRLKPDAKPFKCKVRQYSPEKSEFLAKFNAELVRLGWVIENKESRWACAALPVRKPNSNEFRQANDYRPANSMTEGIAGVMPSLQVRLEECKGKEFYAIFDFIKSFWQLPLHKASQEILPYMTDRGIFTPTRVPQGCTDAALHFQSTVEEVLKEYLHECVLVWIDDLLAYANTVVELMDVIEAILKRLDEYGFKLNPRKCKLFQTEIKWCGRVIN
ncbi:hypothetical protein PF005_g12643 [Phytophthora fragariae]|uniref:Reverse transcriptase domain-containing protein n=1 Tax=Phytophthora fragariae TaxID=53985 RepID=A0A6A3XS26_9STRA|nr:hypothetical protein PF005_g12643 [Phytophthora fragariae]